MQWEGEEAEISDGVTQERYDSFFGSSLSLHTIKLAAAKCLK